MVFGNHDSLGRRDAIGDPIHRTRDPHILLGVIYFLGKVESPDTEAFIKAIVANQTGFKTTERTPIAHAQLGLGPSDIPNAQLIQIADHRGPTITPGTHPGLDEPGPSGSLVRGFKAQLTIHIQPNRGPVVGRCDVRPCVQRNSTIGRGVDNPAIGCAITPDRELTRISQSQNVVPVDAPGVARKDFHVLTNGGPNPGFKRERRTPLESKRVVLSGDIEESAAVEIHVAVIAHDRSVIDRFHIEANALPGHIIARCIANGIVGHQVDVR